MSEVAKHRFSLEEKEKFRNLWFDSLDAYIKKWDLLPGSTIPGERFFAKEFALPLSVVREFLTELKENGITEGQARGKTLLRKLPAQRFPLKDRKIAVIGYLERENVESLWSAVSLVSEEMELRIMEDGGKISIFNTEEMSLEDICEIIENDSFDGMILFTDHINQEKQALHRLDRLGIPGVCYLPENQKFQCITELQYANNKNASQLAEYLSNAGHQNVAILSIEQFSWANEREAAFCHEFMKRNLPKPLVYEISKYPALENDLQTFLEKLPSDVTAVLCVNDLLAVQLLCCCRKNRIRVPQDLSITGIDDGPNQRGYNLTTIHYSPRELAISAYQMLKTAILNPRFQCPSRLDVSGTLIVRETTGKPKKNDSKKQE